jgi:hypothetical protein
MPQLRQMHATKTLDSPAQFYDVLLLVHMRQRKAHITHRCKESTRQLIAVPVLESSPDW